MSTPPTLFDQYQPGALVLYVSDSGWSRECTILKIGRTGWLKTTLPNLNGSAKWVKASSVRPA